MTKRGLIAVKPAPNDLRQRVVSLTQKGEHLVELGKSEVWPRIEAAVADLCDGLSGPLLEQLGAMEDGLTALPLYRRAGKGRKAR